MSTTESSRWLRPDPVLESAFLGDEAVVYDPRTGSVIQLNSSATAVWALLDGAHGVDELATELAEIFGASLAVVRADVDAAVAAFATRGLLATPGAPARAHRVRTEAQPIAVERPREPCACTDPFAAWAGRLTLHVGRYLVGVEYDTEETERAVRTACAEWCPAEVDVAPAFGVRTALVGFRRRRVGLVQHGANVRFRMPDLDSAIAALVAILRDVGRDDRKRELTVPFRVYARDGSAVLVDAPANFGLDDRRLRRARVEEVPCWEPVVDGANTLVVTGSTSLVIAGIVETMASGFDRSVLRRYVWGRVPAGGQAWATLIDRLGDRVVGVGGLREDRVVSSVISLLGGRQ